MVTNTRRSYKIYPSVWNLRTKCCFPAELNGSRKKNLAWWAKVLPSLYWIQLEEGSEKTFAKNWQKKLLRTPREKLVSTMKSNILKWRASFFFFSYIYKENDTCLMRPWGYLISILLKLASNTFHFPHITQITIFSRKNH